MGRRALLIGVPGGGINVSLAAERLEPLLVDELGFSVIRCVGSRATREAVLAALDRLIRQTQPGDACFVHYFGHGGRIEFSDLDDAWAGTVFGFISTIREARGEGELAAVLDIELSRRMAALDEICGNVTVMLDCCYSAELVRGDTALSHHVATAPPVVRELLAESSMQRVALDSHPRIVRLCGASAQREAYATERRGRNIGHMTDVFIDLLEQHAGRVGHLCWGTLIHELRERVIERLKFEGQWVALAGPRGRMLFERNHAALPGTISVVLDEHGNTWLRAGWQQAVGIGDRWAVLDIELDEAGRARVVAEGVIVEVERNRARLHMEGSVQLPTGSPGGVIEISDSMAVSCESHLHDRVAGSPWLTPAGANAAAELRIVGNRVELLDRIGQRPPIHVETPERAIALLEDHARIRALARSLNAHARDACPLMWRWYRVVEPGDEQLPLEGAQLRAGDRVWIDVEHPREIPPFSWFVSAVLVEADGRLRLLNARMPEGIEVCPCSRERIGVRPGRRERGFELAWSSTIDASASASAAPMRLLLLASRRPIQLAHIVGEPLDEHGELGLQGLHDAVRHTGPNSSPACTWAWIDFTLHRN
jgi:hypothetical protein